MRPARIQESCTNISGLLLILAAALTGVACEDDFNPRADFSRRLAVFAILDPVNPVQTVRLAWSYDAEVRIPPEPLTEREVKEAQVRVIRGGQRYDFHDTLVTTEDGRSLVAWVNSDFAPQPDQEYRLEVTVPGHHTVTSAITLPSRMYARAELVRPDTGVSVIRAYHGVPAFRTPPAGFYYRLWVENTTLNPGTSDTLVLRHEIPLRHDRQTGTWVYPAPAREETEVFTTAILKEIAEREVAASDSVLNRRVILQTYALESNFYAWYKIVRGFDDPVSLRLDQADVSFIDGGLGVFGGVISDSAIYTYVRFMRE
ncbi:MAG: DUF4249 family protein [Bacteroidetes bacterium]|nr:DUF4249 family protein [Bacteroidota bacterium]